jgi:hypothetical protein
VHRSIFRGERSSDKCRLSLPGVDIGEPVFIGSVGVIAPEQRLNWLGKIREEGKRGG